MTSIKIPAFVRQANVLTEKELDVLSSIQGLPTEDGVDAIRHMPEIQELTNAFIGDETTRTTHLILKSREYIERGDLEMAWKVILL